MNMAWRNIWRNPRRTLVILTAVFVGAAGMVILAALMKGMVFSMVENSISAMKGHVLVRKADFISDPSVYNMLKDIDKKLALVSSELPEGAKAIKRIQLEGILTTARDSKGVTVVGTDIEKESGASFIGKAFVDGEVIKPEDRSYTMIGKSMSEKLGMTIGKRIVLNMQNSSGDIVSKAFKIKGIFSTGQKSLEEDFVFVPYDSLSKMLSVKDSATEIAVTLDEKEVESEIYSQTADKLRSHFSSGVSVQGWREVMPAISSYLKLFDAFILIWYLVIFIAMGFGIVNTVLMAVYERVREFGLLRSIGVTKRGIFQMIITETSILLVTGVLAGNLFSILLIYWMSGSGLDLAAFSSGADMFGMSRVIYPVFSIKDLLMADVIIFVLGMLVAVYPAMKACGFSPIETMRNM